MFIYPVVVWNDSIMPKPYLKTKFTRELFKKLIQTAYTSIQYYNFVTDKTLLK